MSLCVPNDHIIMQFMLSVLSHIIILYPKAKFSQKIREMLSESSAKSKVAAKKMNSNKSRHNKLGQRKDFSTIKQHISKTNFFV